MDEAIDGLISKVIPGFIGKVLKTADNFAEKRLLTYVNGKLGPKIPDSFNPIIDKVAQDLDKGDYNALEDDLANGLSAEIKTPLIDGTPEENALYHYAIGGLMNLIGIKVALNAPLKSGIDPSLPQPPIVK